MSLDAVGGRLKKLRKEARLSQEELAEKLDMTQSQLSSLENGRINLSLHGLVKVCGFFDVSSEWLLSGNGQAVKKSAQPGLIPLIDQNVEAGYIKAKQPSNFVDNVNTYKIPGTTADKEYRLFEVRNDQMHPTLVKGDVVIAEKIPSLQFDKGTLATVVTKERVAIGRLYPLEEASEKIRLISDNPVYREDFFQADSIREIWKVISKITSCFTESVEERENRLRQLETSIKEIQLRLDSYSN